ncbi:AbiJ-NTD4 domain-containing protein [Robbsia andropogonis]|uniref:AbiJ-NTD4 domain-containing protein n=1 Tax=Robbsia andropogonis TaxID=28092 RepID=UPI000A95667B|nr:hypothetical protein [Robbsia andropogonis]
MSDYFSDRELGPKPRIAQEMTPAAWGGIVSIVESLTSTGSFGACFPDECPDGRGIVGNDLKNFQRMLASEINGIDWPLRTTENSGDDFWSTREQKPWAPSTMTVLDFVEFVWRNVALPVPHDFHSYFQHHHLSFDIESGRDTFRENVNRIFARNGLAYELGATGKVTRILPAVLDQLLTRTYFRTSDPTLNFMLDESRAKFSSPAPITRREGLERLFDAWERFKTIGGENKSLSVKDLLDKAAPGGVLRDALEAEAKELTKIGNSHLFVIMK